uniref:Putative neurotoxin-G n=1 Tax=Lychas mucronatus TaxID=172552 RepID=KTXG_LYCMC|nr:RecName: Full=Putative neurotoxin-G; Flags: Precursor [Lychas mucronatus]
MFAMVTVTVLLLISSGIFCENEKLCSNGGTKCTHHCGKNNTVGICHGQNGNLKCECVEYKRKMF